MNINYIIVSSDKSWYLDFWPIVSKTWKKFLNVTPVLALMDDEESDFYEYEYGLVKKFKIVDGVSIVMQSQISRLFIPKYLNGYCLISDIDMIPLSGEYFEKNSLGIDESNFVIYSSDNPESLAEKMYPMCYILSHSKNFEIFHSNSSFEEFVNNINNLQLGWCSDQIFLYEKVNEYHEKTNKVIYLNRGWGSGYADRRVDRATWIYNQEKVKQGWYIDCHLLRPYGQHKNEIDNLLGLIL
jgi:hypothetical protein